MTRTLAYALAIVSPILLAATPAFATKGIDAARSCNAQPHCIAEYMDNGTVFIFINDKVIECPGPQAECKVIAIRPGQKPGSSVVGDTKTR